MIKILLTLKNGDTVCKQAKDWHEAVGIVGELTDCECHAEIKRITIKEI